MAYGIDFFELVYNKSSFHRQAKIKDRIVSYTYGFSNEILPILGWNGIIDLFDICTLNDVDTHEPFTLEQWDKMVINAEEDIYKVSVYLKLQVNNNHIVTIVYLDNIMDTWLVITSDRTNKYWMLLQYFNFEPSKNGFVCEAWIPKDDLDIHQAKDILFTAWIFKIIYDEDGFLITDDKNLHLADMFYRDNGFFEKHLFPKNSMKILYKDAKQAFQNKYKLHKDSKMPIPNLWQ